MGLLRIPRDLARLLIDLPHSPHLFLRRELECMSTPLRWLARLYRRTLLARTRVAVVAGSVGKTTTRRTLHAALACPERGFNHSNYGAALALNLLRIRPGDRHAAIEAGIAGPGWMEGYARLLRPDIVVMTAIKSDHYRAFPSLKHTREEKVKILGRLDAGQVAFLNGDDENVRWMAGQTAAKVVFFGLGPDNDIRACNLESSAAGLCFTARLRDREMVIGSPLVGEHMVYPLLAALAVAEWEGHDLAASAAAMAELSPVEGRMELIHAEAGFSILDDSYKGSLESVHAALLALAKLPASRRIFLFGGVEDPPGKQGDINREIGRLCAESTDAVYCLNTAKSISGIRSGAIAAGMNKEDIHIIGTDLDHAVSVLLATLRRGDVLLVKGQSRRRLRRITLRLQGRPASCPATYCAAKVATCDTCPLLNVPPALFENISSRATCNDAPETRATLPNFLSADTFVLQPLL